MSQEEDKNERQRIAIGLVSVGTADVKALGTPFGKVGLGRYWNRWGDTCTQIQTSRSTSAGGQR